MTDADLLAELEAPCPEAVVVLVEGGHCRQRAGPHHRAAAVQGRAPTREVGGGGTHGARRPERGGPRRLQEPGIGP